MSQSHKGHRPRLDDLMCFALYSANHAVNRLYKPVLKALDLTYPQYLTMLTLWERDGPRLVGGPIRWAFVGWDVTQRE